MTTEEFFKTYGNVNLHFNFYHNHTFYYRARTARDEKLIVEVSGDECVLYGIQFDRVMSLEQFHLDIEASGLEVRYILWGKEDGRVWSYAVNQMCEV